MTTVMACERSFPTFFRFLRPLRRMLIRRRRLGRCSLVIVSIVLAAWLWWATQLWGLPDIGDPFDVEAFRSQTIPDDRNAFVLYRQAVDPVHAIEAVRHVAGVCRSTSIRCGPTASPEIRGWAEANREALALYRRGADRPDASTLRRGPSGYRPVPGGHPVPAARPARGFAAGGSGRHGRGLGLVSCVPADDPPCRLPRCVYRRMAAQSWHTELRGRLEDGPPTRGRPPRIAPGSRRRACVRGDRPFGILHAQGLVSRSRACNSTADYPSRQCPRVAHGTSGPGAAARWCRCDAGALPGRSRRPGMSGGASRSGAGGCSSC